MILAHELQYDVVCNKMHKVRKVFQDVFILYYLSPAWMLKSDEKLLKVIQSWKRQKKRVLVLIGIITFRLGNTIC